jgi:hypothetical protein
MTEQLEQAWREVRKQVEVILEKGSANELVRPIEQGLLRVELLMEEGDTEVESMVERFTDKLGEVLNDQRSYPLFDDESGSLVDAGIAEGLFSVGAGAVSRGKQVAAASEFLSYVPAFPAASIDEILDIREKLRDPLVRFRGAMVEVASLIDASPFQDEFDERVVDVYREKVAPAIQEIRERVEENAYLRRLVGEAVSDLPKWVGAGILGLATTPMGHIPEVIAAGAAVVEPAVKAAWSRHVEGRAIGAYQYYFLYETERLLN